MEPTAPTSQDALWRAAVDRVLNGADARSLISRSADGIDIHPLYAAAEASPPLPLWHDAGRTVHIVQRLDEASADVRSLAAAELEGGADDLVLTFRGAATARGFGLDPAVLDTLLDDTRLDRTGLRLESPPFAGDAAIGAVERALARQAGHMRLDLGSDPLGDMARCGTAPHPWPHLVRGFADAHGRWLNAGFAGPIFRADARPHHEAGASEAQELAAVLATGVAYLRALDEGGIPPEAGRDALSFVLVADADLLLSICKFRALRHLWGEVEIACGLKPAPIRLHGETAWRMLTRRAPHANLLRGTLAAAAAILGGADSLTVLPFTGASGLPDAAARRLARNTGLVLRDEAHLSKVVDPVAGAAALEAITRRLGETAWTLFQDLERQGGMAAALQGGSWQAAVGAMRAKRREEIRAGTRAIVGTTLFPDPAEVRAEPGPGGAVAAEGAKVAHGFDPLPSFRDAEPYETATEAVTA